MTQKVSRPAWNASVTAVAVSRAVDVFIDANEPAEQIRRVLAGALGGQFRPSDDGNPYLPVAARTVIYAGPHEFTDAAVAPVSQYATGSRYATWTATTPDSYASPGEYSTPRRPRGAGGWC